MVRSAERSPVERLLRPRSVAIVGASADPAKTAGRPARYLLRHGYTGSVFLVNPRYQEIDGLPCYPSIAALPEPPDVALVLVGGERAPEAVRQLAERGCWAAIVLAGGYAESGPAGRRRQEALRAAAGRMRLLGPNTIGLVSVADRVALAASVALEVDTLETGAVAVVSQSGGVLGSLLSRGVSRGLRFSRLVATGNEADLDVTDILEYLIDDDATTTIALYLEGLRSPERFRQVAVRAAERGKPIVAFKVGRSEPGARSAASHTGALAGSDRVYDAFFRQCGVIRVTTYNDLLDVPLALAAGRRLRGRRLAILTSSGGAGALVADACGLLGFETPPPDPETAARLGTVLGTDAEADGEDAGPGNPIDLTLAGLRPAVFEAAISTLLASSSYDALVAIVGSSGLGDPTLVARPVVAALPTSDKPVVVYVSPSAPHIVRHLNGQGVPAFDTPEGCAAALAALLARARPTAPIVAACDAPRAPAGQPGPDAAREKGTGRPPPAFGLVGAADAVQARTDPPAPNARAGTAGGWRVGGLEDLPTGRLNEVESRRLFARFGIPGVREAVAATPEEAARLAHGLGPTVVLKVLARDLAHKSDAGGVLIGVGVDDVASRGRALLGEVARRAPGSRVEGLLVQEQVRDAVELILGVSRDPQLGPVILLGAGGIMAELFGDTALGLPPLDRAAVLAMVRALRSYPLLTGYRGRPPADLDALVGAVVAFSRLVMTLGDDLVEAEINPLFVLEQGAGVRAADALAVLR